MNYRDKCKLVSKNLTLMEKFHIETSLNKETGYQFDESISGAFDDIGFISLIKSKIDNANCLIDTKEIEKDTLKINVLERKSVRNFSQECIDVTLIYKLLHMSYGANLCGTYTVPSAGGTYPITLLLVANRIKGLDKGVYKYELESGKLICLVSAEVPWNYITENIKLANDCAFYICFMGDPNLIAYKYQDRAYRFMNIECGHIAQNLSLIANSLKIASVCSGGFLDGEIKKYLTSIHCNDLATQFMLYEMFFGLESTSTENK